MPLPRLCGPLTLVLLGCVAGCGGGGSAPAPLPPDDAPKVAWLQANALPVRSILPQDTDFTDLEPLGAVLGDARIVMLGEQTHGDGSTFSAKVRLVEFLHQRLGFDVLVFEAPMYDCMKAGLTIEGGGSSAQAVQGAIFPIWSGVARMEPLWAYLDACAAGNAPLALAGMDCQTFQAAASTMADDLEAFLVDAGASSLQRPDWPAFMAAMRAELAGFGQTPGTLAALNLHADVFTQLQADLQGLPEPTLPMTRSPGFWGRWLASYQAWCAGQTGQGALNTRDRLMARNLLWLAQGPYAGRKLVVWAASYHILRNPALLGPEYTGLDTTGQELATALGQAVFALAFTCDQGTYTDITTGAVLRIPPAPAGSFENLMTRAGFQLGLLDLRHLPAGADWQRGALLSRPLGNVEVSAPWSQTLDALFFIQQSEH